MIPDLQAPLIPALIVGAALQYFLGPLVLFGWRCIWARVIEWRLGSERLTHMGYEGTIEYSEWDGVYHGKLVGIPHLVTYEAPTLRALRETMKAEVEDWVKFDAVLGAWRK